VCDWLHAPSQSLPIRFRSSRPFFGEFEGSESEVGRTDEFRGPRDAGNNVSTSLSSGLKKSNRDRWSGSFWQRIAVSLHGPLPLREGVCDVRRGSPDPGVCRTRLGAGLQTPPSAGLPPGSGLETFRRRNGKVRRPCYNLWRFCHILVLTDARWSVIARLRTHTCSNLSIFTVL
jgi:hypothetical protein